MNTTELRSRINRWDAERCCKGCTLARFIELSILIVEAEKGIARYVEGWMR